MSNQRSDTMMLVHIDADRKDVYVMSIMRDTWVPIPGNGTAKINAALAWGGTPLAIQTVEQLLGA
ncbi:MAG: LCP family protein, partial [Leifsonia sp.]